MVHYDFLARLRLTRGVEHQHAHELLAEVGARIGSMPCALGLLPEYRFTPHLVRTGGSDRFPRHSSRLVLQR